MAPSNAGTGDGGGGIPPSVDTMATGVISPMFKLIFLTVTGLTILSLAVSVGVVVWGDPKQDSTKNLLETCSTTWKMGFGAIIGLIGGKAL